MPVPYWFSVIFLLPVARDRTILVSGINYWPILNVIRGIRINRYCAKCCVDTVVNALYCLAYGCRASRRKGTAGWREVVVLSFCCCLCNSVRQSYPDEARDINDREQEIMKMWDTLTVSGWFWFLWPPCVADADILFCSCGFYFSSFFLFFLACSQRLQSECLPYFHTWCGLSVNLECKSEMCCARLAEYTGRKKIAICAP